MSKLNKQLSDFFKTQIESYYETNSANLSEFKLPNNIKLGFHTEMSYNAYNDVDLYVVAQPAVASGDIVNHSFVIELQVVDKYSSVIFDILCDIVKNQNRNIILNGSYKFYANYPNIPMKMEDKGINKYNYISLVCTLITYTNVLGIKAISLNSTQIDFTNFNIAYSTNANSNGGMNSQKLQTTIETGTSAYTLIFVPRKDTVYKRIYEILVNQSRDLNTTFSLKIENNIDSTTVTDHTQTINCVITGGTLNQDVSGHPIINLTLARSD